MTTDSMPAKGAGGMQFSTARVDDLWGRSRKDPAWRSEGNRMVHNNGNVLKLENGKWVSG